MKYKLLSKMFYSGQDTYNQLYLARINSESTYKFEFEIKANKGFVVLTPDILEKITHILERNNDLCSLVQMLPQMAVEQYSKRCLLDEIYLTNEIEGIQSTRKEINDILETKDKPKKYKRLFALVKKYETLFNNTKLQLNTCGDIRALYDDFMLQDVLKEDRENAPDGEVFRADSVYIRKNGEIIHSGLRPEAKIIECMAESLEMLNNEQYNFLIRIAVFHYMFGYIHPFYDGNGRMSRFISSYLLSQKLHFLVSCRLSCAIKDSLTTYYKSFNIANDEKNRGDLTPFVHTFLDTIIAAEEDLYEALSERKDRLIFYRKSVDKVSKDKQIANIVFVLIQNTLFGNRGLTISQLAETAKVGMSKTRNTIKELEEMQLIKKEKEGKGFLYDINLNQLAQI